MCSLTPHFEMHLAIPVIVFSHEEDESYQGS